MIRFTIYAILLLLSKNIDAQYQGVQMTEFDSHIVNFKEGEAPDDFIGSPYLNESWGPIQVDLKGKSIKYRKARYNLLRNHIEVMIDGERRYIKEGFVSSFKILERKGEEDCLYLYKSDIVLKNRKSDGLIRLTKLDNCQIITVYDVKVRKASKENPHLTGMDNKDRLVILKNHYVVVDEEPARIKKTKDLYKLFSNDQKRLKSTIKERDIDIKSHHGIATLLKEINP